MEWPKQIARKLGILFRRGRFHRELDEEMRFHLEMESEENILGGLDPRTARSLARRQVGNLTLLQEEAREQWGWTRLEQIARDVRHSIRMLRRNPGYTAAAALTLGLGIGANCLLFSIVDPVILRPFPYPHPERLVFIWSEFRHNERVRVSLPDFLDWKKQSRSFDSMGAQTGTSFSMDTAGYREDIGGQRATTGFFETLGVHAQMGRTFLPEDEHEGADRVVVISDRFWRNRLHADAGVVGSSLLLSRNAAPPETFKVIGVLPPSVEAAFPRYSDIWGALSLEGEDERLREMRGLEVLARLKPGVTRVKAEEELRRVADGLASAYPRTNADSTGVQLWSFHEALTGAGQDVMRTLMGAVVFVLLLSIANVANLALARGTEREREMTVRAAIGASRSRLFRQVLTESVVLSFAGGIAGAVLAYGSISWVKTMLPPYILRSGDIGVDGRVLLFTLSISMIAGALFGLVPALRGSRAELNPILQAARGSRSHGRLRDVLVVAEVALGFLLMAGAALMINSFVRLLHADRGFDSHGVLTVETGLPNQYRTEDQRRVAIESLLTSVSTIPSVQYAGITDFRPLGGTMNVQIRKPGAPSRPLAITVETIGGDYLAAMGTPLLRGRQFTHQDTGASQPVAMINEAAARKYWPDADPIGQSFLFKRGKQEKLIEIIGITGSVRHLSLERAADPSFYLPQSQSPSSHLEIVARPVANVPPMSLAGAVRTRMANVDRALSASMVTTMDAVVAQRLSKPRFLATVLGVFGFLALALTVTGVYGVTAYTVRARRHEFGVRVALGADKRRVLGLVLQRGSRLVLAGISLGFAGAVLATRALGSVLYEVKPLDAATFLGVSAAIFAAAMAANYIPARRATKIDAWQVLRCD